MDTYTIIEDVFGDGDRNQVTAARGFVNNQHVPEDLRPQNKRVRFADRQRIQDLQENDYKRTTTMDVPPYRPPMEEDFKNQKNLNNFLNVSLNSPDNQPSYQDSLHCRDVFNHVENCPICSSYFKKDFKFYWLIIGILILIIILLTRNIK